jgi:hypothetical protein
MQLVQKPKPRVSPLLIAGVVGLIGLLTVLALGRARPSLPEAYRYPFAALGEAHGSRFQNEIAFYQARIRNNPGDGLDLAALAGAYLGKARSSGQSAWYLLAQQAAERSLAALPFYNTGAELILAEVAQSQHDFSGALKGEAPRRRSKIPTADDIHGSGPGRRGGQACR